MDTLPDIPDTTAARELTVAFFFHDRFGIGKMTKRLKNGPATFLFTIRQWMSLSPATIWLHSWFAYKRQGRFGFNFLHVSSICTIKENFVIPKSYSNANFLSDLKTIYN
ncbi:MAG: hypothetical protein WCJ95_23195 [Mariniphaga sp.]